MEKLRPKAMKIKYHVFNYDKVIFLACGDIHEDLLILNACEVEAVGIDYDPKFKDKTCYVNKDFVFDDIDLDAELVVHMNVEKTYPVKLKGDVILRGDGAEHNGDCCPITSCNQMVEMYGVKEIYEQASDDTHFYVYGRI